MNHMNILLVTSDQQRWNTLGYLNPAIRTPNLDRMAAEGILFERAYTVNPVCTPSRCSMLTGQYPTRHGCFHVGTSLPEDYTPTVAKQLAEAGYFTGLLGKAHFQPCLDPNSFESAPRIHDLDFFRRWSGPYYGFQHAKLVIGHTSESHGCGMHYGAWLEDQGVSLEKYFGIHKYTHFGAWSLPEEYHGSRWVADETIAAVEMAQAASKPFFLWASFQDPHNPYIVPEPWASMYAPDDMPLPEIIAGEMDDKPPFYQSLMRGKFYGDDPDLAHKGWGDCRIQPELTDTDIRQLHAAYYRMISLMDHHIGRILTALEAKGLLENTLVVFTTDHGDYLGAHGLWGKGLPTYEDMQRVPFIVRHPHCATSGGTSSALQSILDLEATFLDVAGLTPSTGSQGICQTASWKDAAVKSRDWVLVEFRPSQGEFMQWTFIEEQYKLVLYRDRDYGELYNLQSDPQQLRNLFAVPAHRDIREALNTTLSSM